MVNLVAFGFLFLMRFASEVIITNGHAVDNPCDNYKELSEANRAARYDTLTKKSDKSRNWKKEWYRFTGDAGDQIASIDTTGACLKSPSCGAKYPGFLRNSHPNNLRPGEYVQGIVCFAKGGKCCFKTETITIMKCDEFQIPVNRVGFNKRKKIESDSARGVGFWIYELPSAVVGRARYCGNKVDETTKPTPGPKCSEKKLLYGLNKKYAAKSCKEIKQKLRNAESGIYWIDPDGNNPTQAYCDQETDGGGWTLVYSYTFTNFRSFRHSSNANTPRPNWPTYGDIPVSTTAPVSETDYNAMDFNQWKNLGHEFMIKSNINHWIACKDGTGSLVDFRAGSLQCRNIKNVASKCHGFFPDQLIFHTAGNPGGLSVGPDLVRSQSRTPLKEYYYFDGNTRTNWPTHDPCGTNGLNHLTNVANPHGNVYIRE